MSRQTRIGIDLSHLNAAQREAVTHQHGPLLVLAGAGSGKTQVIVYRMAYLIEQGVDPGKIVGVTFTHKAAQQMRTRLCSLVGTARANKVLLATFHALGLEILKEESEAAGLGKRFTIYDTSEQLGLLREIMRHVRVSDRRLDTMRLLQIILATKRERKQEVAFRWGDDYELAAYDLYPRYCEQMRAFHALDFDDLILRPLELFRDQTVQQRWFNKFEYLLIDEYQDTSPDQLELIKNLHGESQNICAVGDDDQSIYAWRGASTQNILSFSQHFKNAREIILEQNYRSTNFILQAANQVIAHNTLRKTKTLWSASATGDPVQIIACKDEEDEVKYVSDSIVTLLYKGVKHEDIAILYRSNKQSEVFEQFLTAEQVPFRVVGGQAFFDRKEVKDILAFLSVAANPRDELALRRIINIPARGIGPTSVERLSTYSKTHRIGMWGALQQAEQVPDLPRSAVEGAKKFVHTLQPHIQTLAHSTSASLLHDVRALLDAVQIKEYILDANDPPVMIQRRLEHIGSALKSIERFARQPQDGSQPILLQFLRQSALHRDTSTEEEEAEQRRGMVSLMTLHSAKGLEFPYVFFVGVEEDLLPHKKTMDEGGDVSEECRLCYVGITRARKKLWLTWAKQRNLRNKEINITPSRFLQRLQSQEGVQHIMRDAPPTESQQADNDAMADAFFKQMRAQLGNIR